jgi:hypothetical protein
MASFRSRLAADTFAWPCGSSHLGPQRTCTSKKHNMPGAQTKNARRPSPSVLLGEELVPGVKGLSDATPGAQGSRGKQLRGRGFAATVAVRLTSAGCLGSLSGSPLGGCRPLTLFGSGTWCRRKLARRVWIFFRAGSGVAISPTTLIVAAQYRHNMARQLVGVRTASLGPPLNCELFEISTVMSDQNPGPARRTSTSSSRYRRRTERAGITEPVPWLDRNACPSIHEECGWRRYTDRFPADGRDNIQACKHLLELQVREVQRYFFGGHALVP